MTRRKPTDQEFKNFWSVYEAKQQRKREQLQQRIETEQDPRK